MKVRTFPTKPTVRTTLSLTKTDVLYAIMVYAKTKGVKFDTKKGVDRYFVWHPNGCNDEWELKIGIDVEGTTGGITVSEVRR